MKKRLKQSLVMGMCFVYVASAQASTVARYPWAQTLQKIMDSLAGPVAYFAGGSAIVLSGLAMAFMDLSGGAKKFVQAALGLSIAFGAVTLMSTFFSFSGAVIK